MGSSPQTLHPIHYLFQPQQLPSVPPPCHGDTHPCSPVSVICAVRMKLEDEIMHVAQPPYVYVYTLYIFTALVTCLQ